MSDPWTRDVPALLIAARRPPAATLPPGVARQLQEAVLQPTPELRMAAIDRAIQQAHLHFPDLFRKD